MYKFMCRIDGGVVIEAFASAESYESAENVLRSDLEKEGFKKVEIIDFVECEPR